jgi:serine/threonine protein kinase
MATTLTCSTCGGDFGPGSRFCPHCGAGVLSCSTCGERLLQREGFCPGCGTPAPWSTEFDATSRQPEAGSAWGEVIQRLRRATLGEFEIGPELGRGAMAAVFLAHEISLDRKVAIKVMSPGLLMDEGSADRFRREAITIAHLNHPNIVSVHSVRQAEGLHFFVMRYIRGRALDHVIQQAGKLPIPIVRSILCQVGSALTYAHRSGVVHRDIKPANILIDEDGNAFVTDFGIAKVADQPSETHPGALVGTPAYMSPEQCSGAEVSGSSDQYSLGAVAYEMITGASPFTGSTFTVVQAHLEQPPRSIRDSCGDCPPELESAVLRMLEKAPAARWPSIAQAKAALGATPLLEEDPLLAQLCRLASPEWTSSGTGKFMPPGPRTKVSSAAPRLTGLVRTISILPPPAALETGDSFNLVAMVRGEHDVPLPGRAVQWATDTPEVLRVDGVGSVATAVAPGIARLTATCEGIRARVQVQVAPPMADEGDTQREEQVASLQLSAPPKSVKAGDSFVLTATPLDYRGGLLLGRGVQWSTSDVGVAVVTASGWVAALGRGAVVLKATCENASASVQINVEARAPAPKREKPKPPLPEPPFPKPENPPAVEEPRLVRRRRGSRLRQRWFIAASLGAVLLTSVLWLSGGLHDVVSNPSHSVDIVRSVYGDAGQLTRPLPTAPILRGAPASVAIVRRPRRALLVGGSTRLLAEVRDLGGQIVPGSGPSWSSTNPGVAKVDSVTGWVHALRPGRAWMVAANGEWRDSARIMVRRPPSEATMAASMSISSPGSLRVGDTITLAAAVLGGDSATMPDSQVAWTSSEPRIVAIDSVTGRAQGYAPGTATIVARSGSQTASSSLTVLPTETAADTLTVQGYEPTPGPSEKLEEPSGGPDVSPLQESRSAEQAQSAERTRRDVTIRLGVLKCYGALRSKDIARVTNLYRPGNKSDEDKLSKLTRILETKEWAAVIGERVDGARQVGNTSAAVDFSFQLVWKDAFGGRLTSHPVFRAEFTKTGNEWEISSCRITGSPKL